MYCRFRAQQPGFVAAGLRGARHLHWHGAAMALYEIADDVLGLSLKSEQLGFAHMAARALVMYVLLLIIVRAGKKRFLGRATAFDVILVIMIGSIAARALTGGAPFFPATLGIVVLVAFHWMISWLARGSPAFSGIIKGHSTVLVKDGKVLGEALAQAHMSKDDLDEDLREQSVSAPSQVAEARLERSGRLSVIKK
jgi:uncharacterized membrane protein YcaP (DUF421 family)